MHGDMLKRLIASRLPYLEARRRDLDHSAAYRPNCPYPISADAPTR